MRAIGYRRLAVAASATIYTLPARLRPATASPIRPLIKPGALRNDVPFAELPEGFRRLQSTLLKRTGGDREMVEILALALVLLHD